MVKYYFYKLKYAVCLLNHPNDKGHIFLTQYVDYTKLQFHLKNLLSGAYMCQIYEYGDERANYANIGQPIGSLHKIVLDDDGMCTYMSNELSVDNIMGRTIVIYSEANPTKKIACGVVGYKYTSK